MRVQLPITVNFGQRHETLLNGKQQFVIDPLRIDESDAVDFQILTPPGDFYVVHTLVGLNPENKTLEPLSSTLQNTIFVADQVKEGDVLTVRSRGSHVRGEMLSYKLHGLHLDSKEAVDLEISTQAN